MDIGLAAFLIEYMKFRQNIAKEKEVDFTLVGPNDSIH